MKNDTWLRWLSPDLLQEHASYVACLVASRDESAAGTFRRTQASLAWGFLQEQVCILSQQTRRRPLAP